jgi:TatD DNase family protein
MIDTHCHLTDPRLEQQLEAVLERAAGAGVTRMITVSTDLADARLCVEMCRDRPQVRCAIGIHPHKAAEADLSQLPRLEEMAREPAVLALGEMGLDYHYDFAPRRRQAEVFEAQLDLAGRLGRQVVIHCREAVGDTLAILRKQASVPAVFHCFTGTLDEARRILDAGYLLGFTGAVTFIKSDELREVARMAPADRIVVETDAPYLSPEPMRRQKVNEPALVIHTAAAVARVRKKTVEEIDRITTANADAFFRWR